VLLIIPLPGGKTLRELLTDRRWRWASDEKDADQRRRHDDDEHQLQMERGRLELARDFPEARQDVVKEVGLPVTTLAHIPPGEGLALPLSPDEPEVRRLPPASRDSQART
jgi:hypothetical protein